MIIILIYCVIMGVVRGLFREVASLIGVLGGLYLACMYYMKIATYLSTWMSDPSYLNTLSFLIIFCGTFIIIGVLGIIIRYLLKIVPFGWPDRVSGGVLALIRGILIVSVLLMTFIAFLKNGAPIIRDSRLAPHLTFISERVSKVVSKDMKDKFAVKVKCFKEIWKKKN
ncbi:CvpA family protein [Desulfonema magnum]|nr:CvpA family protein [Desulfonema magnum]